MSEVLTRVLHIIPADGVGGIEIAARSCAQARAECNLLFLTQPSPDIASPEPQRIGYASASQPFHFAALMNVLAALRRVRPDVVVFSLWKTFGVFLAVRVLRPRMKLVLFLHSDRAVHWADRILTRIMASLSHAVFADSAASLARLGAPANFQTRVVSYIKSRVISVPRRDPRPAFIYWGRLQQLKNLPAAIDLFAQIAASEPDAEFIVIGPDVGVKSDLQTQIARLRLERQVRFEGMRSWAEIRQLAEGARFFLQLSLQEGMAMSVVEAMQLGLVVVVTPVGEIANYCHDMQNGVIFTSRGATVDKISRLIADADAYARISAAAIASWTDNPLYADDFVAAASELVSPDHEAFPPKHRSRPVKG
jgi:glycosyltransferase involved in cell wall biosynthesis